MRVTVEMKSYTPEEFDGLMESIKSVESYGFTVKMNRTSVSVLMNGKTFVTIYSKLDIPGWIPKSNPECHRFITRLVTDGVGRDYPSFYGVRFTPETFIGLLKSEGVIPKTFGRKTPVRKTTGRKTSTRKVS